MENKLNLNINLFRFESIEKDTDRKVPETAVRSSMPGMGRYYIDTDEDRVIIYSTSDGVLEGISYFPKEVFTDCAEFVRSKYMRDKTPVDLRAHREMLDEIWSKSNGLTSAGLINACLNFKDSECLCRINMNERRAAFSYCVSISFSSKIITFEIVDFEKCNNCDSVSIVSDIFEEVCCIVKSRDMFKEHIKEFDDGCRDVVSTIAVMGPFKIKMRYVPTDSVVEIPADAVRSRLTNRSAMIYIDLCGSEVVVYDIDEEGKVFKVSRMPIELFSVYGKLITCLYSGDAIDLHIQAHTELYNNTWRLTEHSTRRELKEACNKYAGSPNVHRLYLDDERAVYMYGSIHSHHSKVLHFKAIDFTDKGEHDLVSIFFDLYVEICDMVENIEK